MAQFKNPLPLTEADIDRLEELLESDVFKGDAMLLDELQGFLCGISSGPDLVMPSEWLPVVLGEEPLYESEDQAEEVLDLLLRFYDQIVVDLTNGHMPALILYPVEEGGDRYDYAPWADGYLLGSDMGPTQWLEAAGEQAEELAQLLEAFFLLNGSLKADFSESGEQWLNEAAETRALQAAEQEVPRLVLAIHEFWKTRTSARPSYVQDTDTDIGEREETCPCGSGRKFKQCCGDPKRLH
jgi:uncharacterized protein